MAMRTLYLAYGLVAKFNESLERDRWNLVRNYSMVIPTPYM